MKQKFLFLCSLFLCALSVFGQTLDQSNAPASAGGGGFTVSSTGNIGQSFTAGITGNLSQVNVRLGDFSSFTAGNFQVRIFDGEGYGGTLLNTTVFTVSSLPSFDYSEIVVPLSSTPAVTAGNKYTIDLRGLTGAASGHGTGGGGGPYAAGLFYSNEFPFSAYSLWFKTFVTTPTPATHLQFDGANDFVSVPNNSTLEFGTNNLTIEAMVKMNNAQTNYSGIITKATASGGFIGFQLVVVNNKLALEFGGGTLYGVGSGLIGTTNLNDNNWHHVACVVDRANNNIKLYVDGVVEANITNAAFGTANITTTTPLFIGKERTSIEFLESNIDEVRIWNIVRTAEQINGSKNCELIGTESGLVTYYKFNQGTNAANNASETTLNAATGTNGTLTNFSLNGATSNWLAGSSVVTGSIVPSSATVTTPVILTQGSTASALTATIGSNGTGLLWHTAATGGVGSTSAPIPNTASLGSTSYWVSSTNANGCESARTEIVVTVYQAATHLDFDGANDVVNCGTTLNSVIDPLNTLTVEAWVKPSTNTGLGVIIGNYASPTGGIMQFLLRRDNADYTFWVNGNSGVFKVVSASNAVVLNTWQHIAGVWDGSDLKIYINGVLAATTTGVTDSSFATTTNNIFIGNNQATSPEKFTGSIDEVRIWNSAKTIEQINGSKNCELQGSQSGLIAYYNFNQGNDAQNNSSVTTLNAVTGPNGTLTNFNLNGTTSNWLAGSPVTTGSIVPSIATVTTPVVYTQGDTATPLTATTGANGSGLLWYTTATGGIGSATAPTPSTTSVGSTSYWVTSTNANGCESPRTVIVVTVNVINDECPNAVSLTVGTSSFNDFPANASLTGATNSGTPAPTCGDFQGGDVWYTATVPASGNIVIETNGVGNYDTGLEVYTGACGALNLVSCDDNNGNANYSKIVLLGQTPGTVLRIRVWENFFGISNALFQVSAYDYIVPATHLNFDGANDVVNLGAGLTTYFTGRTQVSIQAWVRPETNTGLGTIVGNYNYPSNINAMQMMLRRDNGNYAFYLDSGSGYTSVSAVGSVVVNTWQHVTGTWDGTTMRIYVNGVLANSSAKTGTIPSKTTSFSIGSNFSERFDGDIDEVRLWNIALSTIDIMNTMNCEAQTQPELVAYYKFNQGNDYSSNSSTTSLTDSSGNSYTGTLTNFALTGATSNWRLGSIVTTGNTCATLSNSSFEKMKEVTIYPNPSNGIFNLVSQENISIEVYDIIGKLITNQKFSIGTNSFDMSNFNTGVYLLKITNENGNSETHKLIKN